MFLTDGVSKAGLCRYLCFCTQFCVLILIFFKCTVCVTGVSILSQASELAEFTAKIVLLEEAKRKKDDEATEWQHKVQNSSPPIIHIACIV